MYTLETSLLQSSAVASITSYEIMISILLWDLELAGGPSMGHGGLGNYLDCDATLCD